LSENKISTGNFHQGGASNADDEHRKAVVALMMGSRHQVYGYIYSLVPNAADAEDIFQETSQVIWEKHSDFEQGTNFLAWATRIAYWQVKAARKRFARSKVVFDETVFEAVSETASAMEVETDDRRDALEFCLGKLSTTDREFLMTRYTSGCDVKEAADESGRSMAAAYKALARLRRSLHACVSGRLANSSPQVTPTPTS